MRRGVMILTAIVLFAGASTAHAGGMNPNLLCPGCKISGPTINGLMVVDTHPNDSTKISSYTSETTTDKAKLAAVWLQKGGVTASAIFRLPSAFPAFKGCEPSLTTARFSGSVSNDLYVWMPTPTVRALLEKLGLDPDLVGKPLITSIGNVTCTIDPDNSWDPPIQGIGIEGILSFEFNIQFVH